jgi:D-alanine-D-alanine ligase
MSSFIGKRIGVLMGGLSAEREVSLKSGAAIIASLTRSGFTVCPIDVDSDIALRLRTEKVDLCFIALHGRYGEDGFIQGVLEMMRIPYTGSGVLSSALGMNKLFSRQVFIAAGIPTPPSILLASHERAAFKKESLPWVSESSGGVLVGHRPRSAYPVVVKPVSEGSSVGVTIVKGPSEIDAALDEAFRFGSDVLIEEYIAGLEVHVGIVGQKALGGIEIRSKTGFYDYTAKYVKGMSEHIFPAPLPPDLYQSVLALGLKAHCALGCSGYSRVDLLLDGDSNPVVLEVNTLPGMTETSLLPDIARGVGMSFDQLVMQILETASVGK